MFEQILEKCLMHETLTEEEAYRAMMELMTGTVNDSQIASFLTILRFRGETVDEMVGFVRAMREKMLALDVDEEVIDTCGTGGDGSGTFNISTAVALVVSSLGVKVAKHGNRAVSSKSGSADVFEHLGVPIQTTALEAKEALRTNGLTFLFAPLYHEAMKYVAKTRRDLRFRTVFNVLGPLVNPVRPKRQLIGVHSLDYAKKMAETLKRLHSIHVVFVTSRDGLDECSIAAETDVVELKEGRILQYTLAPEDVGLRRGLLTHLRVNSAEESARLIEQIFAGEANESATNIVLFNAGVALYVAGIVSDAAAGVALAKEALDSKRALAHLQQLRGERVCLNKF
ncbi:anthranilate phosphoribosyltransferase [Thermolongibacillus altinsuensis]|jgi:anthranilate phosphoribosyltransferase|uniref:Anthranilate phosphoribosyltransferase n=1 Tax=Thermolongibacillus altinsuensis TaxID=575256 RepID=A0A4R1QLU8_9BACL|nr:anthranilate phosphoribosyltransferase [Thermolongibacillus altinsuensis]TCL53175.1 anthranilate phosphoribosyltransferase [Thermolongibacillus altinsuensis]